MPTGCPVGCRRSRCPLRDVWWGCSPDSDSESVITHFLRVSFILSVLPTPCGLRFSYPSAASCKSRAVAGVVTGRDCPPQRAASFPGAVCHSQQILVSALLFSAVSGGGKRFYFRPVGGKRDFPSVGGESA